MENSFIIYSMIVDEGMGVFLIVFAQFFQVVHNFFSQLISLSTIEDLNKVSCKFLVGFFDSSPVC